MPGIFRYNIEEAVDVSIQAKELGIKAIAIFPEVPVELKEKVVLKLLKNNVICKLVEKIKLLSHTWDTCDVALDPYTLSGHDGIIEKWFNSK